MWDATLEDYIEEKSKIPIKFKDPREILLPVMKGLEYFYEKTEFPRHGNIRPKTIFIYQKSDGGMSVKISDLVTSASLVETQRDVLHHRFRGRFGDPEDILALGRLFAYTFSIGGNKYSFDEDDGMSIHRTLGKLSKLPKLKLFTKPLIPIDQLGLLQLIKDMVDINPEKRPSLKEVLSNGFFRDYKELKNKFNKIQKLEETNKEVIFKTFIASM